MSNLTKCKDCGHEVSKRAKACPSCGVGNPANRTSAFTMVVSVIVLFWLAGYLITEWTKVQRDLAPNTTPVATISDADIQEAIAKSDDYEAHRAMFTKAATYLLATRRCTKHELAEYGGFVKAQGENKAEPIYFTYCGGTTIKNRLYVDANTGKVYK